MADDLKVVTKPDPPVHTENGQAEDDGNAVCDTYFHDLTSRILQRRATQSENMSATASKESYPDEAYFARLDTSVKRNTAFIKRLRNITEAQRDSLLKDVAGFNLTKYIEEAAAAIFESRLKMHDVGTAVALACHLHRRYATFSGQLFAQLKKALYVAGPPGAAAAASVPQAHVGTDLGKLRVDLRLGAELVATYMFVRDDRQSKGFNTIYGAMKRMVEADVGGAERDEARYTHVTIITNFCRHFAEEYMGLYARDSPPAHIPGEGKGDTTFSTFPATETFAMRHLVVQTYLEEGLAPYLKSQFKELAALDRANRLAFRAKGELHPERRERFEASSSAFNKLLTSVKGLASAVHVTIPDYVLPPGGPGDDLFFEGGSEDGGGGKALPPDDATTDALNRVGGEEGKEAYIWWDDEDTANFYRHLPDLKTFVPGILFKESSSSFTTQGDKDKTTTAVLTSADANGTVKGEREDTGTVSSLITTGNEKSLEDFLAMSSTDGGSAGDNLRLDKPTPVNLETASTVSSSEDLALSLKDLEDDAQSSLSNFGIDSDLEQDSGGDGVTNRQRNLSSSSSSKPAARPSVGSATPSSGRSPTKKKSTKEGDAAAPALASTPAAVGGSNLMKIKMDAFLTSLPTKINRDLIDEAATAFVMDLNTKINRKRLVTALLAVPRSRTDLLPFYARLVAALNPCMPEVGRELGKKLYSSFRYQLKKKDQVNLEVKLKIVRFLAELTKFALFAPLDACYAIFLLITDLKHHSIEMVAALLEGCGRFLLSVPETRQRAKFLLENLMRKKSAIALDPRYITLIENAYYYCLPDTDSSSAQSASLLSDSAYEATLGPQRRYVRHLLYRELNSNALVVPGTVDRVIRAIRKLGLWSTENGGSGTDPTEPDFVSFFVKTACTFERFTYDSLPALARVLSTVDVYHDGVGVALVDTLLERVRLGIELCTGGVEEVGLEQPANKVSGANIYTNKPLATVTEGYQATIAAVRFLGEAYNYRLVDSALIFRTLYSLLGNLSYAAHSDDVISDDPPTSLFRLRLALTLLETCGMYFDRGASKKRLDCYLIYLQKYYLTKRSWEGWGETIRPFPIDITNLYRDVMELLKPKIKLFENLEEAQTAVKGLEDEYMEQINAQIKELHLSSTPGPAGLRDYQVGDAEFCQRFPHHLHSIDEEVLSSEEGFNQGDITTRSNTDDQEYEVRGQEGAEDQNIGSADKAILEFPSIQTPKVNPSPEDDEFLASFDNIVNESILQRTQDSIKVQNLDITLPAIVKNKTEKLSQQDIVPELTDGNPGAPSTMEFVLICKKGNKPLYKDVQIPYDSRLALRIKHMEEAERKEKEQMKKLTLKITKIQEEEDYKAEMVALQQKQNKLQEELRQNLFRASYITEPSYHYHGHHQQGGKY